MPKQPELMGDRRLLHSHRLRQLSHRGRTPQQLPEDHQPTRRGKGTEMLRNGSRRVLVEARWMAWVAPMGQAGCADGAGSCAGTDCIETSFRCSTLAVSSRLTASVISLLDRTVESGGSANINSALI